MQGRRLFQVLSRGTRDRRRALYRRRTRRAGSRPRRGRIDPQRIQARRVRDAATTGKIMIARRQWITRVSISCDHGHEITPRTRWTFVDPKRMKEVTSVTAEASPPFDRTGDFSFSSSCDSTGDRGELNKKKKGTDRKDRGRRAGESQSHRTGGNGSNERQRINSESSSTAPTVERDHSIGTSHDATGGFNGGSIP